MNNKYKEIIFSNARNYSKNAGISFPGALLKSSLIPLRLLDGYLHENSKILDLGCGEGMFSNALARLLPEAEIYGVDVDLEKLQQARKCRLANATFEEGDAKRFSFEAADAVIFNDMLHHNSFQEQEMLVSHAASLLSDNGLIIIKEVDSNDRADKFLTKYFDSKLYPDDELNFRDVDEWKALLEKCNFEILAIKVCKHPWIASRTVLIAKKTPKIICYSEGESDIHSVDFKSEKPRVFMTGASGFIGYHMAMHLIEKGLEGQEVDLFLLARNPVRIDPALREKAVIVKSDLLSLKNISGWKLFNHIDYVFHFAAEVKLYGKPESLAQNNTEGTRCLTDVFRERKIKRFIHASTMGAVDRQPSDPCTQPINENTPPNPLSVYGKTKLESERLVQNSNLPYSIIRIPWAFGSRMTPDTHVRNLLERVMRNSMLTRINFPGKVSLIASEDLVKAFELVALHPGALNEIFFVAGYPPISLGELFKKMSHISVGVSTKQINIPFFVKSIAKRLRRFLPLAIQNLNSDVLCVDYSKIKKLGFQPEKDLEGSLIQLSAWIHRQYKNTRGTYIVTGAASGIGLELSKKLAAIGKNVLLIDKDKERLGRTAKMLNMPSLCLDLSLRDDVEYLLDYMKNQKELYGMVNCAGVGIKGLLVDLMPEKIDEIIAVNVATVVKLSKGAFEIFNKHGQGVLANISSTAALQPLPYFSVYSASKAFVSSFTRAIRDEDNKGGKIRVLDIIPSGTDTAFQATAGVRKNQGEKLLPPEYVADRIARLIKEDYCSGTYFIGNRGRMMNVMSRVLPSKLNTRIWKYLVKKTR